MFPSSPLPEDHRYSSISWPSHGRNTPHPEASLKAWARQPMCKLVSSRRMLYLCCSLPPNLLLPHPPTWFSLLPQGLLTPKAVWLLLAAEVSIDRGGLGPGLVEQVPLPIHMCRLPVRLLLLQELRTEEQEAVSSLQGRLTQRPCPMSQSLPARIPPPAASSDGQDRRRGVLEGQGSGS